MAIKIIALTVEERQLCDWTHKAIIGFADVPAGTTAQTIKIFPTTTAGSATVGKLPVGTLIRNCGFKLQTQFVSASLTGCTMAIGDVASATTFLAAQSLQTGVTPITYAFSATAKAYTSATENLILTFTPTTADFNTLTAGQVDVYFRADDMNTMDLPI